MELKELLGDRSHIFKKSNIDGFIDIPNALFNSGKWRALNNFCYSKQKQDIVK